MIDFKKQPDCISGEILIRTFDLLDTGELVKYQGLLNSGIHILDECLERVPAVPGIKDTCEPIPPKLLKIIKYIRKD